MKKYSFLVALLASVTFFTSCEEEEYWNGYEAEGTAYTFDQPTATYELDATETQIVVNLTRSNTSGELTLPVSATIDDAYSQLFTAPESVTFANGSSTADYVIAFEGLEIGAKYKIALALAEDANISVSGTQSCNITLNLKYTWVEFGTAEITDYFMGNQGTVNIMKTDGFPIYRIMEPYKGLEGLDEENIAPYIEFRIQEDYTITFDAFKADVYEGSQIYGFLPSDLSSSLAPQDANSCLLSENTAQITPYYYVPDLGGGFGLYPIILVLNDGLTFLE